MGTVLLHQISCEAFETLPRGHIKDSPWSTLSFRQNIGAGPGPDLGAQHSHHHEQAGLHHGDQCARHWPTNCICKGITYDRRKKIMETVGLKKELKVKFKVFYEMLLFPVATLPPPVPEVCLKPLWGGRLHRISNCLCKQVSWIQSGTNQEQNKPNYFIKSQVPNRKVPQIHEFMLICF